MSNGLFGLGSGFTDVARGAADYYLGRENIQDVQQLGREQQAALTGLAGQVGEATQFKPYTVTGTLADVSATPEGGLTVGLSPEQQALQSQLMGQAAGLFGQVGQDPAHSKLLSLSRLEPHSVLKRNVSV